MLTLFRKLYTELIDLYFKKSLILKIVDIRTGFTYCVLSETIKEVLGWGGFGCLLIFF